MARRTSRKRKRLTYDSSETKIVFGLIALFAAIVCLLSSFTEGLLFAKAADFFGNSVWMFGIAFFVFALKMFGIKPDKITYRMVFGYFVFSIAFAAFLSGRTGMQDPVLVHQQEGLGGNIGLYLAQSIGDSIGWNLIRPIAMVVLGLSIPFLVSITMAEYFGGMKTIINTIISALSKFQKLFSSSARLDVEDTSEIPVEQDPTAYTMIGDLGGGQKDIQTPDKTSKSTEKPASEATIEKEEKFVGVADHHPKPQVNVKIKSAEEASGMLMNQEPNYPNWKLPPLNLLNKPIKHKPPTDDIKKNSKIIEQTLASFGIKSQVVDVLIGPTVTQYALNIALGTKVAKIANLRNDMALALATHANGVRIVAPIPGTSYIGIEAPNRERQLIGFRELVESDDIKKGHLPVTVGRDVSGNTIIMDIQKMPHLLIAGSTGSGKSVVTNSFIMSLLMRKSPDDVRLILVDPKQVEMSDYNDIPHLLTPVITDMEKVNNALKWAIAEMERRYTEFKDFKVRNIEGFNEKIGFTAIPYIVIVIDEMADMMMTQHGPEIEASIVKLAQKARATGIHLILATQRPSVNVITGLIKGNIPGRVGLSVTSQIDSRVILDQNGAESLLGRGDMLLKDPGSNKLERIQGCFVSQDEVIRVTKFIKEQSPEVEYSETITASQGGEGDEGVDGESLSDDDLFVAAARVVINARKGSSSLIQRKLSVGYNRAARLLDELEEHGIVGPPNGSKPRDILITDIDAYMRERANAQSAEV